METEQEQAETAADEKAAALRAESDEIEARQAARGRQDGFDPGSLGQPYEDIPWVLDERPGGDTGRPSDTFDPGSLGQPVTEAEFEPDTRGTSAPVAEPVDANPEPAPPVDHRPWAPDDRDKHPDWANRK